MEARTDHSTFERTRLTALGRVSSFASLLGLAVLMLFHGWRRWNNVLVDFGRELYVPWRLSLGDALYRDIAYFNGPLSPHLNAVFFRLFGVSYMVLTWCNIVLLAATLLLLYRLLLSLTDRLTATVGGLLFLAIFALADLTRAGNYNFITPYSHEMTHGSLLGLATLSVMALYFRQPSGRILFTVGLLLGLIFLTKAEFFLAVAISVVIGLALHHRDQRGASCSPLWLAAGLGLPPLIAWLYLLQELAPAQAWRGVLGSWPYLVVGELSQLRFYRLGMGLDDPLANLRRLAIWSGFYLLALGPPTAIAMRDRSSSRNRPWWAIGAAIWVGIWMAAIAPRLDPTDLPRPLPVVLTLTLGLLVLRLAANRREGKRASWASLAGGICIVYALLLLGKMVLHTRFHNYGFALAMPATMALTGLLLHSLPRWIDRRGGNGQVLRLSSLVFLGLVGLLFTLPSIQVYREKNLLYGRGADMFRIQERYTLLPSLLEQLPAYLGPDDSLLVLPEGVMINYQLRVVNPTPYINFLPPELIMFGEDNMIRALDVHQPDVIVLVKRNTLEYGFEALGSGYGEALMAWVGDHYRVVHAVDEPRLYAQDFSRALILNPTSK